jgi:hypothetical protein
VRRQKGSAEGAICRIVGDRRFRAISRRIGHLLEKLEDLQLADDTDAPIRIWWERAPAVLKWRDGG